MKKNKILIFVLVALIAMFALTSCKRANIDDPSMQVNSGFRIILSGTANPSTLYVPENNAAFSTTVNVQALDNKGVPVNGAKVIFEQSGAFYGYFDDFKISTEVTTNNNGIAQVEYGFAAGIYVAGTQFLEVTATLVDDGRLDPKSSASAITDTIPIKVVTNADTYYGEFEIHGHVSLLRDDEEYEGISGVTLTFTNLGLNGIVSVINRDSGSYEIMVPKGWTGTIIPSRDGYTFTPSVIAISTPVYENIDFVNFKGVAN